MNLFPSTARFHQSCAFETDPDGDVVLLIPPPTGWFARLQQGTKTRRLQLDRLGSAVFAACGEGRGWDDLFAQVCRAFPDEPNLERRTELFLRHLAQKGWIQALVPPGDDPAQE
jgi:hypothetical protein